MKIEDEIRRLSEITEDNRYEFLRVELQTCVVALERGRYELTLGNSEEAKKEVDIASRGIEVLRHFLREGRTPHPDIQAKLEEVTSALHTLQSEVAQASRPTP